MILAIFNYVSSLNFISFSLFSKSNSTKPKLISNWPLEYDQSSPAFARWSNQGRLPDVTCRKAQWPRIRKLAIFIGSTSYRIAHSDCQLLGLCARSGDRLFDVF